MLKTLKPEGEPFYYLEPDVVDDKLLRSELERELKDRGYLILAYQTDRAYIEFSETDKAWPCSFAAGCYHTDQIRKAYNVILEEILIWLDEEKAKVIFFRDPLHVFKDKGDEEHPEKHLVYVRIGIIPVV